MTNEEKQCILEIVKGKYDFYYEQAKSFANDIKTESVYVAKAIAIKEVYDALKFFLYKR